MSDEPQGPGWWQASDGQWYPPDQASAAEPSPADSAGLASPVPPPAAPTGPTPYRAPAVDASGQRPAQIGDAFNWAWLKFQGNIGELILLAIGAFVVLLVVTIVGWILLTATLFSTASSVNCSTDAFGQTHCDTSGASLGFFGFFALLVLLWALQIFVSFVVQMVFVRASLTLGYGEKLEVKNTLSTESIAPYLLGALLVTIAGTIGFFLCIIPGILVLFFTPFFGYFILDKKMSAVDGIKASVQLVNKNLGTMIGFFIASYIALAIGYVLCGIGLIVALPVVVIATGFMYRRLQGEPVAA